MQLIQTLNIDLFLIVSSRFRILIAASNFLDQKCPCITARSTTEKWPSPSFPFLFTISYLFRGKEYFINMKASKSTIIEHIINGINHGL